MLEGVIVRGTAASLHDLNLPLFGKTGTTSGPTNVWFVGGSSRIIAGIYLGYDQPRSLGGYAQGGRIAAPVFKQFLLATRDQWPSTPFIAPEGVRLAKIDRVSGKHVFEGTADDRDPKASVIWEAFKPDSEPRRTSRDLQVSTRAAVLDALHKAYAARYGAPLAGADAGDSVDEQGDAN